MNWVHILLGVGHSDWAIHHFGELRILQCCSLERDSTVMGSSCNSCTMLLCPPLHPHCSSVFGSVVG